MPKIIPSLNGLRAICIFMVISSHFQAHNFFSSNKVLKYTGMLFFNGPLAVNIFFIISGFLITNLLIEEQNRYGKISLKKFYLRRILRIFPAYYFLLFTYALLQLGGYLFIDRTCWLSLATFTKQFFSGPWETDHFWSLSVEEVFYLAWPFIFINFRSKITQISFCVIGVILVIRIVAANFPIPSLGVGKTIFTTGDALLIGCLVALYYENITQWVISNKRYIYIALPLFLVTSLAYSFPFYRLANSIGNESINHTFLRLSYGFFGDLGLVTNLLLVFIIIFSINTRGRWYWLLNTPIMNHIGKLSYSIYLWQQLLTADRELVHRVPLLILVVFIYAMALFSYNIIEKPALRLKKKFNLEAIPTNSPEQLALS